VTGFLKIMLSLYVLDFVHDNDVVTLGVFRDPDDVADIIARCKLWDKEVLGAANQEQVKEDDDEEVSTESFDFVPPYPEVTQDGVYRVTKLVCGQFYGWQISR
jgi:hypothetical protein